MKRGRYAALTALLAFVGSAAAGAADLVIARSVSIVSDGVNTLNPRVLPGSVVDTSLAVTNPLGNLGSTVRAVRIIEPIPAALVLRVADYGGQGSGPVEFTDGSLLNLGLLGSNVSYSYAGLANTGDGLDFSTDGSTWTYVPVPDADGYDAQVRAIRVRVTGTQSTGGSFRLRYRAKVR